MAFTTNALLTIPEDGAFVLPEADQSPLDTALLNCNTIYAHFRPPLHNIVFTTQPVTAARTSRFQWPTRPSADGLTYAFRVWIRTFANAGTLTVTIDENDAGWNNLSTVAAIAAPANTVIQHDVSAVISATSTELRVGVARAAGDDFYVESILIWPTPASPVTAGVKASGFVPYDTGLLSTAGAPITTEHVNRTKVSSIAILRDRWQNCLSFVQEDNATYVLYDAQQGAQPANDWQLIGNAVASFPGQRDPTINVDVLATVDAGATADLIKITQNTLYGNSALFDASGNVETATLQLHTDGGSDSHAEFQIWVKTAAANNTYLHAVQGFWLPGD
jgi:hypothetical protein